MKNLLPFIRSPHIFKPARRPSKLLPRLHYTRGHGQASSSQGPTIPVSMAKQAPPKAPLHPWARPSKPWQRVHLDFAGPFMGEKFLLAIWSMVKSWRWPSTTTAQYHWSTVMSICSIPLPSVSDNRLQFVSRKNFSTSWKPMEFDKLAVHHTILYPMVRWAFCLACMIISLFTEFLVIIPI